MKDFCKTNMIWLVFVLLISFLKAMTSSFSVLHHSERASVLQETLTRPCEQLQ